MLTMPRIVSDWSLEEARHRVRIDARHRNERTDAVHDQRTDQEQQALAELAETGRVAERADCWIGAWPAALAA